MSGKKSEFEHVKFSGPDDPRLLQLLEDRKKTGMDGHQLPSHKEHWVVNDKAPGNKLPTSQSFGAGNGGEYRKSFHGYAPGYVQVIESPQMLQVTPMQIVRKAHGQTVLAPYQTRARCCSTGHLESGQDVD